MTGWAHGRAVADAEWRMERDLAESVRCREPRCEAGIRETCRNLSNGEPLENQPAHARRIRDAREEAQ